MADEIQTIELKPGRAAVTATLTGWYDGQWLEFRVVGNSGPQRVGFATSPGGKKSPPDYIAFFDPVDEATGLYSISPADMADVAEGTTLYFTVWVVIKGKATVKATGTVTKEPAIKVPDFGDLVVPEVTLSPLTLSAATIPTNAKRGSVIGKGRGAQPTSTITMPDTADGQFAVAGRDVVVAGDLTMGSHSVTLRETMAGAANSPLDTVLTITVGEATEPAPVTTISQTAAPTLAVPTDGDTAVSAYTAGTTGTYTADNGQTVSSVTHQMRVGGADVADTYALTAGESLTVRETVTASDGTAAIFTSDPVTVQAAAPTNTVPATTSDSAEVAPGGTVQIDVLANDYDADGDALSVTAASADIGSVTIGAAPGYVLTFDATGLADGQTATITYTASDGTDTAQGTATVSVVAPEVIEPGAGTAPMFSEVQALYDDPSLTGPQITLDKQVGIDPLPSGSSVSGDVVTWSGHSVWDGWDFNGHRLVIENGATGSMDNCLLVEPPNSGWDQICNVMAGANVDHIRYSRFLGAGADGTVGSLLAGRFTGEGYTATGPDVGIVELCDFGRQPYDSVKSNWGGIFRFCYFDPPENIPYTPPTWTSGDVYNAGDYVTDASRTYLFTCQVDGTTAAPPGAKVALIDVAGEMLTADSYEGFKTFNTGDLTHDSDMNIYRSLIDENKYQSLSNTAAWEPLPDAIVIYSNKDPHADQWNPYLVMGSRMDSYGHYFNRDNSTRRFGTGFGWGMNNSFRGNRNTGSVEEHLQIDFHHSIIGGQAVGKSIPTTLSSSTDNREPDIVRNNWIETYPGGAMIHPDSLDGLNQFFDNVPYSQTDITSVPIFPMSQASVGGNVEVTFNKAPIINPTEGITVSGNKLIVDASIVDMIAAGTITDSDGNTYNIDITLTPTGGGETPPPSSDRFVYGALGQSEIHQWISPDSNYSQQTAPTPALTDETNLRVWLQQDNLNGGAPVAYDVTEAEKAAGNINPAVACLSNFLALNAPGWKFGVADFAVAGTGFDALVDDSNTSRAWSDLTSVVDAIRGEGLEVDHIDWWWYNSTHTGIKKFGAYFAPGLIGQHDDGTTFTLGTTNTENYYTPVVDHCLWDGDAAADSLGRGYFRKADTTLGFIGPMPFFSSLYTALADGEELRNFTTKADGDTNLGRTKSLDKGAWEAVEAFSQKAVVQTFHGANTPAGHLLNFGGPTGSTHPDVSDPGGTPQVAYLHGINMLKAAGFSYGQPVILGGYRDGTDPKVVRVEISLPNGGTLTTPAAIRGDAAPTGIPHFHQIMGFELGRNGEADTNRSPIWNTTAARDAAYTGTVEIENAGSGTGTARKGVVRITLTQDAAATDYLEFLRGGRTAILDPRRDDEVWRWLPTEYVAAMDPGGDYPFYGFAVQSQPDTLVLTNTGSGGGTTDPEPTTGTWDVTGGAGSLTITSAPTVTAPTATGGAGKITITE